MIDHSEASGAPETGSAKVSIIIPCRAEYVAIARLAILGVANRLAYSYDEVEDVRLAVGEACSHAVNRAQHTGESSPEAYMIWIESDITPEGLNVEVRDNVPTTGAAPTEAESAEDEGFDKEDLGALLMEILVDKVTIDAQSSGTTIHLFKAAPKVTVS